MDAVAPHGKHLASYGSSRAPLSGQMGRRRTRRMEFASLIEQQTILKHIDREIARLEDKLRDRGQLSNCINSGKLAQKSSEVLANLSQLLNETDLLRIDW
jgi:hypothetical protein